MLPTAGTDPSWPQCLQGYRIVNGTCHDVNECEEQPRVCDHLCSNTNGSYECACRVGFDKDNEKCVQSELVDLIQCGSDVLVYVLQSLSVLVFDMETINLITTAQILKVVRLLIVWKSLTHS